MTLASMPRSVPALHLAIPLLLLSLAAAAPVGADETDSPLRAGAWAVDFEVDPTFQYDVGYTGSVALSVRRHSSARTAWRLGVIVGFSDQQGEGESAQRGYSVGYADTFTVDVGRWRELHEYSLFLRAVRFYPVRDGLAVLWEAGPSFRYGNTEERYQYSGYPGFAISSTSRQAVIRRTVALDGNLGFEWFFSKRLSLGARVGAFIAYSWGSSTRETITVLSNGIDYDQQIERLDTNDVDVRTKRTTVVLTAYF